MQPIQARRRMDCCDSSVGHDAGPGAPDTPNLRNPASLFLPRTTGWSAATLHQVVTTEGRPPDALTFSRCLVLRVADVVGRAGIAR